MNCTRLVQVGAVDLDSQWATADNNCTELGKTIVLSSVAHRLTAACAWVIVWSLCVVCGVLVIFNTAKYPNASQMIDHFHKLGVLSLFLCTVRSVRERTLTQLRSLSFADLQVRVILWVTSMIDTDSSNHAEAIAKDYILKVSTFLFSISSNWLTTNIVQCRDCGPMRSSGGTEWARSLITPIPVRRGLPLLARQLLITCADSSTYTHECRGGGMVAQADGPGARHRRRRMVRTRPYSLK
jgi:hypothetical protein